MQQLVTYKGKISVMNMTKNKMTLVSVVDALPDSLVKIKRTLWAEKIQLF